MSQAIYQVDAFTQTAFKGNPAAVCLLRHTPNLEWMQALAAEMNLSETAMVERRAEANAFNLRWFTPTVEVDLCGHATLAAAHVLWQAGEVAAGETIYFHTRSGVLTADMSGGLIALDFPIDQVSDVAVPSILAEALGVAVINVAKGRDDYLVEVASEQAVRQLVPDFAKLAQMPGRGLIVTARGKSDRFDFVSRFFAPNAGIDEDPVTGSAHCTLAGYWQARLGKKRFSAYQASPRGGVVEVEISGTRVTLSGQAITVMKGELYA